jgi:hypothetical protein
LAFVANGGYLIFEFQFGVEKTADRLVANLAHSVGSGAGGSLLDGFIG